MTTVRASYWLVTINNPTQEDRDILKSPPDFVKQLWYQDEVGKEGTPHIQLCANTVNTRFSQVKSWLPRAHIEAGRNSLACVNYCKKSDTSKPGSFVYWKAGVTAQAEPEIQPMTADLLYLFNNLPYNWPELDPTTIYQRTLHDILINTPQLVNRLTQQRVRQNFDLCFQAFLEISREVAENSDVPDDASPDRPTDCQIVDCLCSRCLDGDYHKCYYDDGIITLDIV